MITNKYVNVFSEHNTVLNIGCYISDCLTKDWDITEEERKKLITSVASLFNFSYINELMFHNLQFVDWSKENKSITIGFIMSLLDKMSIEPENHYKLMYEFYVREDGHIGGRVKNYFINREIVDEPEIKDGFSDEDWHDMFIYGTENLALMMKMTDEERERREAEEADEKDEDEETRPTKSRFIETRSEKIKKYLNKTDKSEDEKDVILYELKKLLQSIYDQDFDINLDSLRYNKKKNGFVFTFKHLFEIDGTLDLDQSITVEVTDIFEKKNSYKVINGTSIEFPDFNGKKSKKVPSLKTALYYVDEMCEAIDDFIDKEILEDGDEDDE